MSKTVEVDMVREIESGLVLLTYDIPYPPSPSSREEKKRLAPWFSWYDWATSALRRMGYPLQYSVIVMDEARIPQVEELRRRIEDKRQSLNRAFGLGIPEPRIAIIKFSVKDREDAEALLTIIREGLKSTLQAFVEEVEKQLSEGKDRTRVQERVREFVKKLRSQDFLQLMLRDDEIRNLVLQLEILTA